MTEKPPKTAFRHVLSVMRTAQLRTRLEQEVSSSQRNLKAYVAVFMQHGIEFPQAFGKFNSSSLRTRKSEREGEKTKMNGTCVSQVGAFSCKDGAKIDPKAGKRRKILFHALPYIELKRQELVLLDGRVR